MVRAAVLLVALGLCGCPRVGGEERLSVLGTLERDGISNTAVRGVEVDYLSEGSRAEWWPCDLRVTAQGCVGEHHVNVYIGRPGATVLSQIGTNQCVVDGVAGGVYEAVDAKDGGTHDLANDLTAFVVVGSNVDDTPGANLENDEETTAASFIVSGSVEFYDFNGFDGQLAFYLDGVTDEGNAVQIEYNGPSSNPGVVPVLEGPSTCVDSALVQ